MAFWTLRNPLSAQVGAPVESLAGVIPAEAEMSALTMLVTVALSTSVFSLVGVTISPETNVLPLVTVAIRGKLGV